MSRHDATGGTEGRAKLTGTKIVDFEKPLELSVLKDRVALVTGGVAGIGLGVVNALVQAGAWVTICDLNEQAGREVEAELVGKGYKAKFIPTDTSSWESQLAAFKATLAWTSSRLDIVIPNAGVGGILNKESFTKLSPLDDPPKPPTLALEVNLTGVYYTAMLAVHYFNARVPDDKFKPQLCFVSSLAGYGDVPFSSDYAAAKWGVRGMWRSLRGERGVNGLGGTQTNLIAPTFIRTAMTADFSQSLVDAGVKVGEVEDVVQAILRVVADGDIDGRAIGVVSGEGKPGSLNFDLEDDLVGHDGGKALLEAIQTGKLGAVIQ